MGLIGQAAQFGYSKALMEDQQAFIERQLKNQIQWRYDDMRAAGINPILAAATGGGGAVGGGMAAPGGADAVGSAKEAATFAEALKQAKSTTEILKKGEDKAAWEEETAWHERNRVTAESTKAAQEAVIGRNEMEISTAQKPNRMQAARSRREMDTTGAFGLSGADMRKWNAMVQMWRGQESTGAQK